MDGSAHLSNEVGKFLYGPWQWCCGIGTQAAGFTFAQNRFKTDRAVRTGQIMQARLGIIGGSGIYKWMLRVPDVC
jgi:hypothetical protein